MTALQFATLPAMTYGLSLPPTTLVTGLNIHSLIGFLEDLDADSASELERLLLEAVAGLERDMG